MSSSRKLKIALSTIASVFATMAIAAVPASADQCTVTVALVSGRTLTVAVSAPPGTPASQLVPPGTGPVKSVTASCVPTTTVTTPTVSTSTTTTPMTTPTTPTTTSTPRSTARRAASAKRKHPKVSQTTAGSARPKAAGTRRASARIAATIAVSCLTACTASAPAVQPRVSENPGQLRGVDLHPMASDENAAVIEREFSLLEQAGADSVRFDIFWTSVEWTAEGDYDQPTLRWLDWVFAQARAHRLKVILDVWSTPCWASSAPLIMTRGCTYGWWNEPVRYYPPVQAQTYANFCAFAAKRWGPYLAALELWNEPNSPQFLSSSRPARDYAALVKAAYPAVKAVAPGLPVIMSLAGTDTRFLGYLYDWGVQGYYDGIAVHPYNQPTFAGLKAFRAYQLRHGDTKPLWVTEVGWPSSVGGEQLQAQSVIAALDQLAALRYVAAVELYDMRDGGTDPANPQDNFGLLNVDFRPKPAWSAFATTVHDLTLAPSGTLPRTRQTPARHGAAAHGHRARHGGHRRGQHR